MAVPVESSVWDRITNWASEHKALVYTIAGVAVVVTGAGIVYYLNSDAVGRIVHIPNIDNIVTYIYKPSSNRSPRLPRNPN